MKIAGIRIDKRYKIFGIILLLFIAGSPLSFSKTRKSSPLNIILITIDSLRADHLGCYGYRLDTSPNIDRFAKEGALFTQAITQSTITPVALSSLHTSTYPRTHGVYGLGCKLNSKIPTLAHILKQNNYITAAILDYNIRVVVPGLDQGFDFYFESHSPELMKADKITQTAISWLEKNHNNKFFLWLHYFDTHGPYRPPSPYNNMFVHNFELGKRRVPISKTEYGRWVNVIPGYVAEGDIEDVDYYISQYDGVIRFTDSQIGILLEKIKELNLDEKSILIITADHGESLDEYGHYFCHGSLYDQVLKVPLLIKCKGIIPLSKIINRQVQLIDIVPTVLAALHIPKEQHMQGNSLLQLIFGNSNYSSSYAFSEAPRSSKDSIIRECVRANGWKLIYSKNKNSENYVLYNLNIKEGESNNLAGAEREKLEFLKKKLVNWRKRTPFNEPEKWFPFDKKMQELFKSLGYVQ